MLQLGYVECSVSKNSSLIRLSSGLWSLVLTVCTNRGLCSLTSAFALHPVFVSSILVWFLFMSSPKNAVIWAYLIHPSSHKRFWMYSVHCDGPRSSHVTRDTWSPLPSWHISTVISLCVCFRWSKMLPRPFFFFSFFNQTMPFCARINPNVRRRSVCICSTVCPPCVCIR